jgi:capsular polysaccharide biosynthesis protein
LTKVRRAATLQLGGRTNRLNSLNEEGLLKILRRRGWIVVLAALVVTFVSYLAGSLRQGTYSAEAVAVVAANRTLTPDQANRLAVTDAGLIPTDTAIADAVARLLGTTRSDVFGRISVFNDPGTALLRVRYKGTSAENALAGASAVALSISGSRPASPNIAPGTISIVRVPSDASSSKAVGTLVVIGAALGLALGALLLVAWERTDPRLDDLEDLGTEVNCPTSSIDNLTDAAATALLERWRELGGASGTSVALLPTSTRLEVLVPNLARSLAAADTTRQTAVASNGPALLADGVPTTPQRAKVGPTLFSGGVPGGSSAGQGVALACDLTVLVAEEGSRRRDVRQSLNVLREYGIVPAWAILASRSSLVDVRARAQAPIAESRVAEKSS